MTASNLKVVTRLIKEGDGVRRGDTVIRREADGHFTAQVVGEGLYGSGIVARHKIANQAWLLLLAHANEVFSKEKAAQRREKTTGFLSRLFGKKEASRG